MNPYYSDNLVTLYHIDSSEVAADVDCDLVLTDPPYGVNYDLGNDSDSSDNRGTINSILNACRSSSMLAFGVWDRYSMATWEWRWTLVWHKPMARANPAWNISRHYELIHWYTRGKDYLRPAEITSDVITANPPLFRSNPENVAHPAQKPLQTIGYLLEAWRPERVFDPFAGSGTTLVAAKSRGLRAIGCELEERYCEIIANRLAQGSLFALA